ncbi:lipocalin family protein [Muriicola soli]|nr:lipocalin family protein [Muriicola soli]
MRNTLVLFLLGGLIISSCSTDKVDGTSPDAILGTWDLTALDIDQQTASDEEEFGQVILSELSAENCYLVSLTFNQDSSLITEDASNYLEIGVNAGGTGLEVPCPSQRDTETTTYTYADGVLTFVDENQATVSLNVTIDGRTMIISAQELDVENFNAGGELIFSKR